MSESMADAFALAMSKDLSNIEQREMPSMTFDKGILYADSHEPPELLMHIDTNGKMDIAGLNIVQYADYLYIKADGKIKQWERKTWSDLGSNLNAIEDQLYRQMKAHPDVEPGLIIEGIPRLNERGFTTIGPSKTNPNIYTSKHSFYANVAYIYAWLHQVEQFMEVHYTFDYGTTATFVNSAFQNDQKTYHDTFRRQLKTINFHPNMHVRRLLGLAQNDLGIGVTRAESLIYKFHTVWNVVSRNPEELAQADGITVQSARRFLKTIGRVDIP